MSEIENYNKNQSVLILLLNVIISTKEKRSKYSVENSGWKIQQLYCIQHFSNNIIKKSKNINKQNSQ